MMARILFLLAVLLPTAQAVPSANNVVKSYGSTGRLVRSGVYPYVPNQFVPAGAAVSFNNSSTTITVTTTGTTTGSMGGWFKSTASTFSNNEVFIGQRNNFLLHPNSGAKTFTLYTNALSNIGTTSALSDLTIWNLIIWTINGSTSVVYHQGVSISGISTANTWGAGSAAFKYGHNDTFSRYFSGLMDGCFLTSEVITPEQALKLYNNGVGAPLDLVLNLASVKIAWSIDENGGTTLYGMQGSVNGTLGGGTWTAGVLPDMWFWNILTRRPVKWTR